MSNKTKDEASWAEAKPGDQVRAPSEKVGQLERRGEIAEVLGDAAIPMFKVRWEDGHETVFVPGPDASVESKP